MHVLLLHNEATTDRPDDLDTLQQVQEITAALHALGHSYLSCDINSLVSAENILDSHTFDAVFNLVESLGGSDCFIGLIPALLEMRKIHYTGNPATAFHLTANKPIACKLMAAEGIAVPPCLAHGNDTDRFIVKSATEHASLGMDAGCVVMGAKAAKAKIAEQRTRYGGEWFAEGYIDGREINISVISEGGKSRVLAIAEILFEGYAPDAPRIVDYAAKWQEETGTTRTTRAFLSAEQEPQLYATLENIARQCWQLFGLRGYARIDLRVDGTGKPYVLEVNPNPCLSRDAGLMAAAQQAGFTPQSFIAHLLEEA